MSTALPTATYFLRETGLSRGQDDATAKKRVCTWWREYFRFEDGQLACVNEMEDGLMWFSPFAPLPVPARTTPVSAEVYQKAEKRYLAKAAAKRAREAKEKAFRKQLASGDIYGLRTPVESEAELLAEVVVVAEPADKVLRERSEASLPLAHLLDDFTVIDLEFQGKFMLEICAIRYKNWEPFGEPLVSFVHFTEPVWRAIADLTGITALHLHDAPSEKAVLRKFFQLAEGSLLVCHSVGADRTVLEAARVRQGKDTPLPNPWLCTLALAKRRLKAGLLPSGQKCGLGELCHYFKIKVRGAHRAKADVQMCFQLLRKLHEQQPVTKADLYGAPVAGKSRKATPPAGPGLFAEAA